MKSFLISVGVQCILWVIAVVICGLAGIAVPFGGAVWFLILIVNVLLGMVINVLIDNV